MQTAAKKQVLEAIGELGRRVTPADIATKTGLPVLVAQQELNRVASETGGHLQVGTTGDIVYSFQPGFTNAYMARGVAAVFQSIGAKFLAVAYYLLRISFGIALILSLVIVVVLLIAIAVLMMMKAGGDRDDGDGDFGGIFDFGRGFHFSFWDWMILREILWWNSSSRYQPAYYDYNQPTIRQRGKSNFLLNCFSFLFGDGDPNEGLQEKRWQVIAQVIKKHNNVVTAEQLAPYTGADPKDEDAVLPTLVRFNGRPEVTRSGNIVYVFDSMQLTAADNKQPTPPAYLQEFPWKFSNVPDGGLLPVYIVAGFNLAGAGVLWNWAHSSYPLESGEVLPLIQLLPFLEPLLMVLLSYGIAFVTVPVIRTIFNAIKNKGIDARNVQRFRHAQIVQHPTPEVAQKLAEAREYQLHSRKLSDEDIVFTTEKDARDQDDDLSDQFKQLEKSSQSISAKSTKENSPRKNRDGTINVAPTDEEDDDGRIIDLRKHAEEFDASP